MRVKPAANSLCTRNPCRGVNLIGARRRVLRTECGQRIVGDNVAATGTVHLCIGAWGEVR